MNKGLIVGITKYEGYSLLVGAANDARKFFDLLSTHSEEIISSFTPPIGSLKLVTDEEGANRDNIIFALHEMCDSTTEGDLIMFYFAGHGFQSKRGIPFARNS